MLPEEYGRLSRETGGIPISTKAVMVISLEVDMDPETTSAGMRIMSFGSPYELKELKMKLLKHLKQIATDEKIQYIQ